MFLPKMYVKRLNKKPVLSFGIKKNKKDVTPSMLDSFYVCDIYKRKHTRLIVCGALVSCSGLL